MMKKILLSLLGIITLGFINFSSASLSLTNSTDYNQSYSNFNYSSNSDLLCVVLNSCNNNSDGLLFTVSASDNGVAYNLGIVGNFNGNNLTHGLGYCTMGGYLSLGSSTICNITINEYDFVDYTFDECKSTYNLVDSSLLNSCKNDLLIATGNLATCELMYSSCESELNICTPALSQCLSGSGSDLTGLNWSALFINDIQHIGNSIIDITIPEEISWDYLNTGDIFEIDIEGYNVDTEYIDNIIRTQNYKPTSEDFTELVGMFAPYSKIIIFCVFLFIVWAWIKKPFKSKKL